MALRNGMQHVEREEIPVVIESYSEVMTREELEVIDELGDEVKNVSKIFSNKRCYRIFCPCLIVMAITVIIIVTVAYNVRKSNILR